MSPVPEPARVECEQCQSTAVVVTKYEDYLRYRCAACDHTWTDPQEIEIEIVIPI